MATIPVIPDNVAAGAEVDVGSITAVNASVSGISGRLAVQQPLRTFTCTVGPGSTPDVRAIFYTHRRRWPVAIRDWADYVFVDEELTYSLGDDSNVLAPLRRLIQPGEGTRYFHQRVLLPDEREEDVVIKVDATPLTRDEWDFDNFGIANIPQFLVPSGSTITWSGRALVPVTFLDDVLAIKISVKQGDGGGIASIPQMRLGEILEPELNALMDQVDDSI